MCAYSASVSGETERRDWRIIAMPASAGSAFIVLRLTGRASFFTGATSTACHLPVSSVLSGAASRTISMMPTASSPILL